MQLMWNNIFHMKQCVCSCYFFYDLRKPEKQVKRGKYFPCHSWKVTETFVCYSRAIHPHVIFGDLIFYGHKETLLGCIHLRKAGCGVDMAEVLTFVTSLFFHSFHVCYSFVSFSLIPFELNNFTGEFPTSEFP